MTDLKGKHVGQESPDLISFRRRIKGVLRLLRFVSVWTVLLGAFCSPVLAQTEDEQSASRASAFRAVEGSETEQVPGGNLLIGAYGVAWLAVAAFVWRLGRLHASNRADLETMRARLVAMKDE